MLSPDTHDESACWLTPMASAASRWLMSSSWILPMSADRKSGWSILEDFSYVSAFASRSPVSLLRSWSNTDRPRLSRIYIGEPFRTLVISDRPRLTMVKPETYLGPLPPRAGAGVLSRKRTETSAHSLGQVGRRQRAISPPGGRMRTLPINAQTTMFTSVVPIPTVGNLPVNSYLIRGAEPTLIDTGITPEVAEFGVALRDLIDPNEIRWIIVTHADRDHVGALSRLLTEAPNATVVTSLVTFGLMSAGSEPIPPERAFIVRDGST